jgi:transposase
LLESAAQGADISNDALVDARAGADRIGALVEIASAKVSGYWPTVREAHVKLLQAQVEVEQAKLDVAIAAGVASAEDVDAAMAKVHELMAVQRDPGSPGSRSRRESIQ